MKRRKFLVAVLSLSLAAAVGCSSGTPTSATTNGFHVQSTATNAHSHSVTILDADLANPPAAGVTYTSSATEGHSHTLSLTQAELVTIQGGGSVTENSSQSFSHFHTWTIIKP